MADTEQKKRKGCYNCMKRRIVCDQRQPHCQKCAKKGLLCPGYGVRYRFAEPRAARAAATASTAGLAVRRRHNGRPEGASASSMSRAPTAGPSKTREDAENVEVRESQTFGSLIPAFPGSGHAMGLSEDGLPPLLVYEDAHTRRLFKHFAEHVSPVMLLFDDEANGYRHEILPYAHADPVMKRAVCVAAAFHLSKRMPELRAPAEAGRHVLIRKLREMAPATTAQMLLDERAWAVILLLVVADLITGHEHVLVLYRMLALFQDAWARQDAAGMPGSNLGRFLYYQSRLISFFAYPVLDESAAMDFFTSVLQSPVGSFERYAQRKRRLLQQPASAETVADEESNIASSSSSSSPSLPYDNMADVVEVVTRYALEIYLRRARWTGDDPQQFHEAQTAEIARLRGALESVDPTAPGAHAIVWPSFVGAAEAEADDDRQFFLATLHRIGETTGYGNVKQALLLLPQLWERQSGERWTAALPRVGTVVM